MATKQSSTLKAKTTRRAAKPAKKRKRPAAACPVEKLGRENERLDMERWGIEQLAAKMTGAQKENAERLLTIIHDKMRANRIAATYLKPRSNLGAAFLLRAPMPIART